MAWSTNAEPIYALRINRVEPLYIPLLSKLCRAVSLRGIIWRPEGSSLSQRAMGACAENQLQANAEPGVRLLPRRGLCRRRPCAAHFRLVLAQLHQLSECPASEKLSRNDPGARHASFDFNYRLPFLRNWVTLYSDSIIHDDVSPVAAPRHAAINPGIYISHFPGAPKLDFRAEAVSTDPPTSHSMEAVTSTTKASTRTFTPTKATCSATGSGARAKAVRRG